MRTINDLKEYGNMIQKDDNNKAIFELTDGVIEAFYPGKVNIGNYRIVVTEPYISCISDNTQLVNKNDELVFSVHDFDVDLMSDITFGDYFCVVNNVVAGKHLSSFKTSYNNGKLTVTLIERPDIILDQYYIAYRHNTALIELGKITIGQQEILLGDVDSDTNVNAVDASMILKEYALLATGGGGEFDDNQNTAGDVNRDGAVDAVDASSILAYYAYTATGGKDSLEQYLK